MKLMEFLYFYLMPETPYSGVGSRQSSVGLQRSPSKRLGASSDKSINGPGEAAKEATRTTVEKQRLLGKYLPNVEDLVEDLRESAPYGASLA